MAISASTPLASWKRWSGGCLNTGELCDSCLAEKQRRLPFSKTAKYHMAETLELVHGDLCGPITPATPDGRKYFILLVDDCMQPVDVAAASG